MKEEKIEIDAGDETCFYYRDNGNIFGIAFDRIFKQPLNTYNEFEMNSRRNFKNLTPIILSSYEQLFLNDDDSFKEEYAIVLYNILNAKFKLMMNEDSTSYNDFIEILDNIVHSNDDILLKHISKYVEDNYALDLNKKTEEAKLSKKKTFDELQLLDSHAKTLLKIAYLYRIMVPVISVFFAYNKSNFAKTEAQLNDAEEDYEDLKFEEANANIFSHLFSKFTKNPQTLKNKLYKLVYSRVVKTSYTDKKFWTLVKPLGMTRETETLAIYSELLTHAIPKLVVDKEKNIVSFFQSVINNQINFLFQVKFKNRFSTISRSNTSSDRYVDDYSDAPSEYERMEIQLLRSDEGQYSLRKLSIQNVLKTLPEKLGVEVSDVEVKKAMGNLTKNVIQERIISLMTYKYFEDPMSFKFLNFYQYTEILLLCKKFLEKHKFVLLSSILTAKCSKHKERVAISGKRIRPLIQASKHYNELFTKYKFFKNEIEKPLSAIIGTTYSSVFTDENGKEIFDASIKVGKIAEELVDLVFLV